MALRVPVEEPSTASEADFKEKKAGDLMAYSMRRRRLVAAALVAVIGFAAGIGYRFSIDNADERELANYLRSGVHGAHRQPAHVGAPIFAGGRR
jgi:hypothetical protein